METSVQHAGSSGHKVPIIAPFTWTFSSGLIPDRIWNKAFTSHIPNPIWNHLIEKSHWMETVHICTYARTYMPTYDIILINLWLHIWTFARITITPYKWRQTHKIPQAPCCRATQLKLHRHSGDSKGIHLSLNPSQRNHLLKYWNWDN